jgi:hypothetical protein
LLGGGLVVNKVGLVQGITLIRKQLSTRITSTSYKQQTQLSTRTSSENERSERTRSPDRRSPLVYLIV